MEQPNQRITTYFNENSVFTLATSQDGRPYCAICFYAYVEEAQAIVFLSKTQTRHIREALIQPAVAGTVYQQEQSVKKMCGIQFTGTLESLEKSDLKAHGRKAYFKKFPFAKLSGHALWVIRLNYIKMTDNRLGFGKKLIWHKENESVAQ